MNQERLFILAVFIAASLAAIACVSSDTSDAEPELKVLIDKGNGETYWTSATGGTLDEVFTTAFSEHGLAFSSSGSTITVDGLTQRAFSDSTCTWRYFVYSGGWVDTAYNGNSAYDGSVIAIGFYPSGIIPTVTPAYKTAWTAIHGDALNSGSITNHDSSITVGTLAYSITDDTVPASYSSPLTADGHLIVELQEYQGNKSRLACYDLATGTEEWTYKYAYSSYELGTPAIYGGNAYFPLSRVTNNVLCIPLDSTDGAPTHQFSGNLTVSEHGSVIMRGMSCIVYDSGHLFVGSTSGTIYCLSPNLDLIWETQVGAVYPSTSITVANGLVYVGSCDGCLYILDEVTGVKKTELLLYYNNGGRVSTPAVIGDYIFVSFNDGKGMSCSYWNAAVLKYNSGTNILTKVNNKNLDLAIQNNHMIISPSKAYVFAFGSDLEGNKMYRIYPAGTYQAVGPVEETHGGFTLVDNTYFYGTDYDEKGSIRVYNMSLDNIASFSKSSADQEAYTMASTFVAGNYVGVPTDSGMFVIRGTLVDGSDEPDPTPEPPPVPPEPGSNKVKFMVLDNTGFYFVIEGEGETVMNAFEQAIEAHGYSDYIKYSGGSVHDGIQSLFGLSYVQIDESHFRYWTSFQWSTSADYWATASNTMDKLLSSDNPAMLLCYMETNGMSFPAPAGLPSSSELVPLKVSNTGTRFLIQSSTTEFFVVNGTGSTVQDALTDACGRFAIPYTVTDGVVSFFGIEPSSDSAWRGFIGDSGEWVRSSESISSSTSQVYSFLYGSSMAVPTVSVASIANVADGGGSNEWITYAVAIAAVAVLTAALVMLVYGAKREHMSLGQYAKKVIIPSSTSSKVKQNKIRLLIVCTIGLVVTFAMFIASLAIGPSVTLSLPDTVSALASAIGKHGNNLDFKEIIVYETRLPRAMAALAVGIGLSIAGCAYQAIIRNPLVDPYIMGVSSGAGTMAVAAIAANFTFFGLLANNSFATPILAAFGGLLAFGLTMIIAEKAGGSSTNYVLAGVVIGLVFSAIQTLMLITSDSEKLTSAISWLFGSFANVGWNTVWIIVFPALFLATVPLFWAKELNLVLLGEDQAKQMGLDVRKFNRWMLILASVLTSVCVAFVGIIGFVGMVIPHLSRMLLGGDHRLVLPSSIMMGGALMLFADLLAKMLMVPTELPVGAITTIIGVPVFAYLLIKKGRMYNG